MGYDRYTTTHHLTKSGWVRGEDRPDDAIETWECLVDQPSGWSKEDRTWSCKWASSDVDRAERDRIRNRHRNAVGLVAGRGMGCRTYVGEPL